MTEAFIDLTKHVRLDLEPDGLRVGLVPHDGGIGVLLTLHSDLGKFVVGLAPNHLQVLWAILRNLTSFSAEQYKQAYDELLALAQQEEQ